MTMTRKEIKAVFLSVLPKEMNDVIIEVRKVTETQLDVDIASNKWLTDNRVERLDFVFAQVRNYSWMKQRAAAICCVTLDEYKEMKKREMGL
jgi:hypothetical protein